MENQENQKSNSSLKAVVIVLALLLVGSLVYIFKLTNDSTTLETAIQAFAQQHAMPLLAGLAAPAKVDMATE